MYNPLKDANRRLLSRLRELQEENERLRDGNERLQGMVEWMADVIVDARDACQRAEQIEPMGSPEWVESGIAMRTTALREISAILNRERNADPSRYDALRAINERLRAIIADLESKQDD